MSCNNPDLSLGRTAAWRMSVQMALARTAAARCAPGGFGRLPRGPAQFKLDWRPGRIRRPIAQGFSNRTAARRPFGSRSTSSPGPRLSRLSRLSHLPGPAGFAVLRFLARTLKHDDPLVAVMPVTAR